MVQYSIWDIDISSLHWIPFHSTAQHSTTDVHTPVVRGRKYSAKGLAGHVIHLSTYSNLSEIAHSRCDSEGEKYAGLEIPSSWYSRPGMLCGVSSQSPMQCSAR